MEESYNHNEKEKEIIRFWEENDFFTPQIDASKKPFSIFLVPPNASGPMHIGNAFMIAIQDILARYFRSKGSPTLWVPITDHGGYETEITYEKTLEKEGKKKSEYKRTDLFRKISEFVEQNNILIKNQIKKLGASVDWTRYRYNMDEFCVKEINRIFGKMTKETLISRRPYMVYYCPVCATVLSDIELKEKEEENPLYYVKFDFVEDKNNYVPLATTQPELLFSVTHVLVHPQDKKHAHLIGKKLKNPINGNEVEIIESKRKFDLEKEKPFLSPLFQSYVKYDYEYALINNKNITARNLIDWEGNLLERYPGMKMAEARKHEVSYLEQNNKIEKINHTYIDSTLLCKNGHPIEPTIVLTWSLDLDHKNNSLRNNAIQAIEKESMVVLPQWRNKELMKWISWAKHWPIARQNVWGIKIPIWYDISNPEKFVVWFVDRDGTRNFGNLKSYLEQGIPLQEISAGLERIYTADPNLWTLEKKEGKEYLPETDVFDTWFSGQWSTMIYGALESKDFSYFYPSHSVVIGHDLIRLSISRKIMLNCYLTGKLPYKYVYFHNLINGPDGKKMSKSYGNVVSLESYLEKYGADVTRASLISYTDSKEDFILSEKRLDHFKEFTKRLWKMGRVVEIANAHALDFSDVSDLSKEDQDLITLIDKIRAQIGMQIERFSFVSAQIHVSDFLFSLEEFAGSIQSSNDKEKSLAVFKYVFKKYLVLLHPFMPFICEELYKKLFDEKGSLSTLSWLE